ncbi:hypothetical protein DQK32_18980 [Salmonella enterica subsp. enterica serovar Newport]|uniref:Uncharacterized protein n=1 Tax=Salmonella newport TaxID=108619 RepID=A0A5U9VU40_SALNE|nr:hypothetical protein [Salmonella enterica]EBS4547948.1 hypothetical protein [Salmonella enterica subsp. enterica serovar Newport]EBS5929836.1 hypothetical protein [Salmonella enterica subsp. enterica serovar Saintpaul]
MSAPSTVAEKTGQENDNHFHLQVSTGKTCGYCPFPCRQPEINQQAPPETGPLRNQVFQKKQLAPAIKKNH